MTSNLSSGAGGGNSTKPTFIQAPPRTNPPINNSINTQNNNFGNNNNSRPNAVVTGSGSGSNTNLNGPSNSNNSQTFMPNQGQQMQNMNPMPRMPIPNQMQQNYQAAYGNMTPAQPYGNMMMPNAGVYATPGPNGQIAYFYLPPPQQQGYMSFNQFGQQLYPTQMQQQFTVAPSNVNSPRPTFPIGPPNNVQNQNQFTVGALANNNISPPRPIVVSNNSSSFVPLPGPNDQRKNSQILRPSGSGNLQNTTGTNKQFMGPPQTGQNYTQYPPNQNAYNSGNYQTESKPSAVTTAIRATDGVRSKRLPIRDPKSKEVIKPSSPSTVKENMEPPNVQGEPETAIPVKAVKENKADENGELRKQQVSDEMRAKVQESLAKFKIAEQTRNKDSKQAAQIKPQPKLPVKEPSLADARKELFSKVYAALQTDKTEARSEAVERPSETLEASKSSNIVDVEESSMTIQGAIVTTDKISQSSKEEKRFEESAVPENVITPDLTETELEDESKGTELKAAKISAASTFVTEINSFEDPSSGRKYLYEPEELIKLKGLDFCRQLPIELRDLGIELDPVEAQLSGAPAGSRFGGSGRFKVPAVQTRPGWPRGAQSQQGSFRGGIQSTPVVAANLKPLQTTENAWKISAANSEKEKVVKEIKGILNKLSKEMFDELSLELVNLKIPSYETLLEMVRLIQEKALNEPNFADMYAELCKVMVSKTSIPYTTPGQKLTSKDVALWKNKLYKNWSFVKIVQKDGKYYWTTEENCSVDDDGKLMGPFETESECEKNATAKTEFKRILLSLSQNEFQDEDKYAALDAERDKLNKSLAECTTEAERVKVLIEIQEVNFKANTMKRRILGNMIFIGELFKKDLLTIKVLAYCLSYLSNLDGKRKDDAENIECLCKMLTTAGKTLALKAKETRKSGFDKNILDALLTKLSLLATDKEHLDSRRRFMCKDVVALSNNRWEPIKEELVAKTKQEIRDDLKKQTEEKEKRRKAQLMPGLSANLNRNLISNSNTKSQKMSSVTSKISMPSGPTRSSQRLLQAPKAGPFSSGASLNNLANFAHKPSSTANKLIDQPVENESLKESEKVNLTKKVRGILDEFANHTNENELKFFFDEIVEIFGQTSAVKTMIIQLTVSLSIEGKDALRNIVQKFLTSATIHLSIEHKDLMDGLQVVARKLSDTVIDSPRAAVHFADLIAGLLVQSSLQFTTDDAKQIVSEINEVDSDLGPKISHEIYKKLQSLDTGELFTHIVLSEEFFIQ